MALPSNYKQIAAGAPTAPPTPASSSGSGSSRSRSSGAGGGGDRNKDTTPIFTHSNYGNPAFTPQKAGKSVISKSQAESRTPKPPKPPEKPVLPYMRYSKHIWDSVKAQFPDLKLWELGKKIGAMWKQLSETEKQEFIDEYETDKAEYEKSLKTYHNSPAYLTYLAAKSKVKTDSDVHETPTRAGGKSQQERRIDIQPAEDEDDQDEGFSFKHLAYARYLRNHRLINEIFSDAVVPDVRSVVTTQRMQVLKRQVSSLTMHQTKLEAELQQMEEKFEAKKQRMVESSEAFQEELKRHCKPAVDEEIFQKMVARMYEEMKRERQRSDEHPGAATGTQAINLRNDEKSSASSLLHAGKREASGAHAAIKESMETGSKTDPEPMDIEPPPKPSVPLPSRTESQKPGPKLGSEIMKEGNNKSQIQSIIKGGQPLKVPTPTPTPPPPSAIAGDHTATNQQNAATAVANQMSVPPAQTPPPQAAAAQQPQVPPSMQMHPHHPPPPPTHSHLPQHMPPHQPMSAISPHSAYGNYGTPAGPTRSPYYQPQYGAHPAQPYGQYAPYPHYQQPYGPPPGSHYINARPPPQHNGSPVHYAEHGTPVPGQPPQQPHDVYGQPPSLNPSMATQQQQQPPVVGAAAPTVASNTGGPTTATVSGVIASDTVKGENEKKDGGAE